MVIWHWTYGKGPLSERRNPLQPLNGLLFPISSKGFLYTPSHSYGALAGTRTSLIGPDLMTYLTMSYIWLPALRGALW